MFVKIGDSFINPTAIAMVACDQGESHAGIVTRPQNPNRCTLLTIGGHGIEVPESAASVLQALARAKAA